MEVASGNAPATGTSLTGATEPSREALKARAVELIGQGLNDHEVARALEEDAPESALAISTVRKYRHELNLRPHRPGRPPGLHARDGGEAFEYARRHVLGLTQEALAVQAGTDRGTISRLEGIWGAGVGSELASRLEFALDLDRGYFTSAPCPAEMGLRRDPPQEREGAHFTEAREQAVAYGAQRGLWPLLDAANEFSRSRSALQQDIARGLLPIVETRRFGPLTFHFVEQRAVKALERQRYMRVKGKLPDGRGTLYVSGDVWNRGAWKDRLTRKQRSHLKERAANRERVAARLRTTDEGPAAELHGRWRALWENLQAEYPEIEPRALLGDVALLDWQEHRHDWPRDRYPAKRNDPMDVADWRLREVMRDRVRYALT